MRCALTYLAVAVLAGACGGGGSAPPPSGPTGPPDVRVDVVREHAEQFSEDIPERRAGSQEELAAATYITGHLQQAGYIVLLDAVPVKNLVRSTNVVANPPSGDEPQVVVAVPYGSAPAAPDIPEALGVFLELARALRVRDPEHSVEFVALGAEFTDLAGGRLGSRRLAQLLLDEDVDPVVVVLDGVSDEAPLSIRGTAANEIAEAAGPRDGDGSAQDLSPDELIWQRAGLDFAYVRGPPEEIGPLLLDYLAAAGR